MALHYAPGVYVEAPRPRGKLDPARIDVAGFVGIAERGSVGVAVAVDGWPAFLDIFGNFLPNAFLAYAVRAFFENGGRRCHIVRVAADEVETTLDPAAPQPADGLSSVVLSSKGFVEGALASLYQWVGTTAAGVQPIDRRSSLVADARGFAPGTLVTVRQAAAPVRYAMPVDAGANEIRWREPLDSALDIGQPLSFFTARRAERLVNSVAGNTISWNASLVPDVDPSRPIEIRIGAGTARGTIFDEDARPLLTVEASSPGQWGNGLSVAVRRSRGMQTGSRKRPQADPDVSLSVETVTGFVQNSLVEIVQDGVPTVRRRIAAVEIRDRRLVWDVPLPATFDLVGAAAGTKPIRLRRLLLSLSVERGGRLVETFPDLDLPTLAEPLASLVNERSKFIRVSRVAGNDYAFPDPTLAILRNGTCVLTGGRDGIAMLKAGDIVGDPSESRRRGLRAYEIVDEPAAIAIPDMLIDPMQAVASAPQPKDEPDPCSLCPAPPSAAAPAPPPAMEMTPRFSADDVLFMQQSLVTHCEARGDRLAVLDAPRASDRPDPYDLEALLAWRQRFDSSYAAAYYPWIELTDPLTLPNGRPRAVPPSGHVLGCFARSDFDRGPQAAPANLPLRWAAALPRAIEAAGQEGLNPVGLNCIRSFSGRGIRIYGARMLASHPDWCFLNVRRTVIRLKRALSAGLRWAVLEPNDTAFIATVFALVEGFLETEWAEGRLAGGSAEEAFFVRQIASQDSYDRGEFILEIGIAPIMPAEFVVLRLSRNEDRLEIAEETGEVRP